MRHLPFFCLSVIIAIWGGGQAAAAVVVFKRRSQALKGPKDWAFWEFRAGGCKAAALGHTADAHHVLPVSLGPGVTSSQSGMVRSPAM